MRRLIPVLLGFVAAPAEIIDRVAVAIGRQVIPSSAIDEQLRVTAFLDNVPLDLSPAARRRAAERIIDQMLIRREMELSRYTIPESDSVQSEMNRIRKETQAAAPGRYGIDEAALRRYLELLIVTRRFIDLRFRPGSTAADGEIELYYRDEFIPNWRAKNPNTMPPELDGVRDQIERILLEQKVNEALFEWLKQARTQVRIVFFEEAFQ